MRPVRRAALVLAAALSLALPSARADDPATAAGKQAPPAKADASASAGSAAAASSPGTGAAKDFFEPARTRTPRKDARPWSSRAEDDDGGESVEVVRTGRCGG